jgi:hypothetical protein
VEFAPGDMNLEKLTACQHDASSGIYAEAMSGYLQWLASQYPEIKKELPNKISEWRDTAMRSGQHPRTPEIIAHLLAGLIYFLRFAESIGAVSTDDAKAIGGRAWRVLLASAKAQTVGQAAEEPARRFLDLLGSTIFRGDAYLEEPNKSEQNRGRLVGWMNGDGLVLLEPDSAYAAANLLAIQQGESLSVSKKTLAKRLAEGGFLAQQGTDHAGVQRLVGGHRRRVWCIKAEALRLPEMDFCA